MTRPKAWRSGPDRVVDIYEEPPSTRRTSRQVCHSVGYWLGWKSLDVEGKAPGMRSRRIRGWRGVMGATAIPKAALWLWRS